MCHLIAGRNVGGYHIFFILILFLCENKCKFIPKGMAVSLPLNYMWKAMLRIYRQKMYYFILF